MKSPRSRVYFPAFALSLGLMTPSCAGVRSAAPGRAPGSGVYAGRVASVNSIDPRTFDAPTGHNAYGAPNSTVTIPMYFPILGRGYGFSDEFGAQRDGHRHLGQDLFAAKMTPLVAVFDGTIFFTSYATRPDGLAPHNIIHLRGDNGYLAKYMHVNNDTPGTNDGRGSAEYAFAPGLVSGQHVRAGQFIGWVGNSGNAETTPPHTHFEIWGPDGMVTNATASLRRATHLARALADISLAGDNPRPGSERWNGIVRSIDTNRGVLVLNLLATTTRQGTIASTRPGLTCVRVDPRTVIRAEETGDAVRFREVRPGDRIALTGRTTGKSRTFTAFAATVTSGYPQTAWTGNTADNRAVTADAALAHKSPPETRRDLGKQISDWWNGVKRRGRL